MTSRREFLGMSGLAAAGCVAAKALPALANDDPSLFAKRGAVERLVLAYQHIHLGLKGPVAPVDFWYNWQHEKGDCVLCAVDGGSDSIW